MVMLYSNPCYKEMCYKGTAMYSTHYQMYSKTCVKRPLKNTQNKGLNDN